MLFYWYDNYIRCYFLVFQLGFEQSAYEVGEGDDLINDIVYIVKLNENILQTHYNLTIHVLHDVGPYSAVLGELSETILHTECKKNDNHHFNRYY